MEIYEDETWRFFYMDKGIDLEPDKVGKWMYFYSGPDGREFAEERCIEAVENGIVKQAKVSKTNIKGVACFYLEYDDEDGHEAIIEYLLDYDMVRKTKTGRLYNISFKRDDQTRAGEYGENYKSDIKLENFVDLDTGRWVV